MTDITWRNETRRLDDLVPWEHNPKRMTKKQAEGLRLSIERFGFAVPFLIDDQNNIYDGHQRQTLMGAIREYGPNATVDVRVSSRPLTDDERRELVVRLKQNQAGWDFDMLPNLYDKEELLEWGFEPEELGMFPADDKPDDPGAQIDRASELQEQWQTAVGQLWAIGEHRLIVGDCRDPETWARLLDGVKVNGVFTSPPYAEQRKKQYGGTPADEYVDWWEAVQANVKANLASDGSFFVNIKEHTEERNRSLYVFDLVCAMVRRFAWHYRDDYRWTHGGTPGDAETMQRFKNQHEPVYWFTPLDTFKFRAKNVRHMSDGAVLVSPKNPGLERIQGKSGALDGAKIGRGLAFPGNVLSFGKNANQDDTGGHVAAFPVALPDFFVRAYSDPGDLWLDPFCGSGTTIIAAAQNNRRGYGIELLPKYAAVILERLQGLGIEPVLLGSSDFTVISNG